MLAKSKKWTMVKIWRMDSKHVDDTFNMWEKMIMMDLMIILLRKKT